MYISFFSILRARNSAAFQRPWMNELFVCRLLDLRAAGADRETCRPLNQASFHVAAPNDLWLLVDHPATLCQSMKERFLPRRKFRIRDASMQPDLCVSSCLP
jgi:hypothetical protein